MKPPKDLERRVEALETRIVDPAELSDMEIGRRLAFVLTLAREGQASEPQQAAAERLAGLTGIPLHGHFQAPPEPATMSGPEEQAPGIAPAGYIIAGDEQQGFRVFAGGFVIGESSTRQGAINLARDDHARESSRGW